MAGLFQAAQLTSILSFLFYGMMCLLSPRMKLEFQRYGLPRFRKLTGILQIAGAVGLSLGFNSSGLTLIASLGLCILMLLGMGVRIKIRDPWYMVVPAFAYAALNLFIFLHELPLIHGI